MRQTDDRYTKFSNLMGDSNDENKKDYISSFLIFRIILYIILILLLFCSAKWNTNFYSKFKNDFLKNNQTDYSMHEIKDALKSMQKPISKKAKETFKEFTTHYNIQNGKGGEDISKLKSPISFAPIITTFRFYMPVHYTKISSPFGKRTNPITHKKGFHKGIDLAAPLHSPIYAAFDGIVTEIGKSDIRGNYIILSHGSSLNTVYCHCNKILIKMGQQIYGGSQIATVGTTGQSTGPHLHFEIKLNDIIYNPIWLFKDYAL